MNNPAETSHPRIWNPNAAACWCLLLSPAFGAFLHAKNADALGRYEEAKANRVWVYTYLAYLGITILSIFIPIIPDFIFNIVGLALLLSWYFTLGKKQIKFVKEELNNEYEHKPWAKPLLIGFGCLVAFLILVFIVALLAELATGQNAA